MPSHRHLVIERPGKKGGARLAGDENERQPQHMHQAPQHTPQAESVSKPGGSKNDPDDPTNPNEARERHLRKLRR